MMPQWKRMDIVQNELERFSGQRWIWSKRSLVLVVPLLRQEAAQNFEVTDVKKAKYKNPDLACGMRLPKQGDVYAGFQYTWKL